MHSIEFSDLLPQQPSVRSIDEHWRFPHELILLLMLLLMLTIVSLSDKRMVDSVEVAFMKVSVLVLVIVGVMVLVLVIVAVMPVVWVRSILAVWVRSISALVIWTQA